MESVQTRSEDIRIHQVPKHAIASALRKGDLQTLLARGMAAAGVEDALPVVMDVMTGQKQLWVLFMPDSGKPQAAWLTTIHAEPDGKAWVSVSVLAGHNARRWAGPMSDRMVAFARAEGATRFLFFGRKGWSRLARGVKSVGAHGETHVFERAAT